VSPITIILVTGSASSAPDRPRSLRNVASVCDRRKLAATSRTPAPTPHGPHAGPNRNTRPNCPNPPPYGNAVPPQSPGLARDAGAAYPGYLAPTSPTPKRSPKIAAGDQASSQPWLARNLPTATPFRPKARGWRATKEPPTPGTSPQPRLPRSGRRRSPPEIRPPANHGPQGISLRQRRSAPKPGVGARRRSRLPRVPRPNLIYPEGVAEEGGRGPPDPCHPSILPSGTSTKRATKRDKEPPSPNTGSPTK
jgi:hypothetical protein